MMKGRSHHAKTRTKCHSQCGFFGGHPGSAEGLIPLADLPEELEEFLAECKDSWRDEDGFKLVVERTEEGSGCRVLCLDVSNKFAKAGIKEGWGLAGDPAVDKSGWGNTVSKCGIGPSYCFDSEFPESERLPRNFIVTVIENVSGIVEIYSDGVRLGNRLSDNRYPQDGYRFHDVFHLSNAAVLGWSPITRWLLKRKRKSDPRTDEMEDGGRAIAIEEGISAMVFSYAEMQNFYENNEQINALVLGTIKRMTGYLEVSRCTVRDWERAIYVGFDIWRKLKEKGGATLEIDLDRRDITILK